MTTKGERGQDEAAIRALEQAYDAAWNVGDVRALLALFMQDAVLVNPFGEAARGRAEIARSMSEVLGGFARGSQHTSVVLRLAFVGGSVAVVDGEASLERVAVPNGAMSSLVHRFTDIVTKSGGKWLIAHTRTYVLISPPPAWYAARGQ